MSSLGLCENMGVGSLSSFGRMEIFSFDWQKKLTEICIELTSHSPPPTPLLPALTPSAGEYRVSGGELKVSRQVGLPRNPHARRPKPKNGLPLFLAAFSRLLSCRHGGATGFLLLLTCEVAISVRSAGRTCSTRRMRSLRLRSASCAISSGLPPLWEENRLLETC